MTDEKQQPVPDDHEPLLSQQDGPFFCAHCTFYELASSGCREPHIIAKYGGRSRDGLVTVHPFQCSDYYQSTRKPVPLKSIMLWVKLYAKPEELEALKKGPEAGR